MKPVIMDCPYCGAKLKLKQDQKMHCEYCDSDIFLDDSENSSDKSLSAQVDEKLLKKWKRKRLTFIFVHLLCVLVGWFSVMRKNTNYGLAVLALLAGFAMFCIFPMLTVSSKPMSDAQRANFKKGKALLVEYLIMLGTGSVGFWIGAIAGYAGAG